MRDKKLRLNLIVSFLCRDSALMDESSIKGTVPLCLCSNDCLYNLQSIIYQTLGHHRIYPIMKHSSVTVFAALLLAGPFAARAVSGKSSTLISR